MSVRKCVKEPVNWGGRSSGRAIVLGAPVRGSLSGVRHLSGGVCLNTDAYADVSDSWGGPWRRGGEGSLL